MASVFTDLGIYVNGNQLIAGSCTFSDAHIGFEVDRHEFNRLFGNYDMTQAKIFNIYFENRNFGSFDVYIKSITRHEKVKILCHIMSRHWIPGALMIGFEKRQV